MSSMFLPEDSVYICECGAKLRFASSLQSVVEVDKDNPQQILNEEHICNPYVVKQKKQEVGLDCMKREVEIQKELYGKFESSAQFGKDRNEQIKQKQYRQRGPLTEDHRKNIADSMHTTLQSKKELSFLAQNSKQKTAEVKEIER